MDYLTQELIEKYKSEMQKMISNVKTLNDKVQTENSDALNNNEQSIRQTPQPSEQSTQTPPDEQNIGRFPYLSSQEPSPPRAWEFPRFETEAEGLTRRIEEILRQNSDVITSDDFPDQLGVNRTREMPNEAQNETQIEAQTEVQTQPEIIIFSETPPPMQFQLPQTPASEITFEDQAPAPQTEPSQQPQLQPPQQPPQTAPPQTEPPQTEADQNETPQQIVSRVCIRGGQKAQYSPPANTGLALYQPENANPALTDTGTLRIQTFAANRAFPVANAVIRIRNPENNELVAVLVTDAEGDTTLLDLPAPDRNLSKTPEFPNPFVNYLVDISAEGFVPQTDINVQMFGGIGSVLPANLVPQNNR